MISRTRNERQLHLALPEDLTKTERWPGIDPEVLPKMLLVLWWIENFLARPHKDLGRTGPTCPFIRPALERNTVWLSALTRDQYQTVPLEKWVLDFRDWFLDLDPVSSQDSVYKTILITLPDLTPDEYVTILDATQAKLKPSFIQEGLMIGQFHPDCEEGGVRNPAFRPLKSPVPLLAIRKMTPFDFMFLKREKDLYDAGFLQVYFKRFAPDVPPQFVDEIMRRLAGA